MARVDKDIAETLNVSVNNVKNRQAALRKDLGFATRAEIVLWAYQNPECLEGEPVETGLHASPCGCGGHACRWLAPKEDAA